MKERLAGHGQKAGDSYRAILSYLNGDSEPSLAWLREAADLTAVRLAWLVTNEGEKDAVNDELAKAVRGLFGGTAARAQELIRQELGAVGSEPCVQEGIRRLATAWARDRAVRRQSAEYVWGGATAALASPLKALDQDISAFPPEALEHYLVTHAEALRHLLASGERAP